MNHETQSQGADRKQAIRELIKIKFGSIRRFCQLTNTNYNNFRNMLLREPVTEFQLARLEEAYSNIMQTNNNRLADEISAREREKLRDMIKESGQSISALSVNAGVPRTNVRDILNGTIKKKTDTWEALINYLNL